MANNSNNSNVSAYDLSGHTVSSTDNEEATTTMERKYFCCPYNDQKEKFEKLDDMPYIIDIFGSSPFQFGNSPLVAAHERVLELLVLDNLAIRRVGPFERFVGLAKNVTELLLSGNLLGWAEVSKLFRALPQLRVLNLSHNTALNTSPNDVEMAEAQKLDVLILNGLSLSFAVLRHVLPHAPALNELHLAKNNFVDISTSPPSPQPILLSLRELHLNECALSNWCQVLTVLCHFPQLKSLFLAGNAIKTVDKTCACGNKTDRLCGELNALSLSNTMLSSWEAIENLESIRRLEELRVANIPLMDAYSEEERRHLVIGRLGALKLLNGSRIDERQREEAERFFIRYYTEVEKRPMVYERLVAEHGILEQLVKVDLTPKRYAKVLIRCDETEWVRTWVRLRLSGTVHALMQFAERLTNISIKMMRIFYMERSGFSPTELRVPSKQLRLLHIEDGDEFVVQSKMVLCAQPRQ
uniref:Copine C-terminal domain-containing protein n=1 Tax=Globodera rostochiensis TaxID=31243 RepID=A0A914I505_GLORO